MFGQLVRQAVGTEQKQVAGLGFQFKNIGSNTALSAQSPGDDVSERRAQGICGGHAAHPDPFLNQRMVPRDLLQAAVAQPVTAAVADVEHPDAALLRHQAHQGGAHAVELHIALGAGEDGLVGGADGLFGRLGQRHSPVRTPALRAAAKQAQHLIHRDGAGNFTSRGSAHAVADDVDSILDGEPECVFVGRALAAAVGSRRSRVADYSRGQEGLLHRPVYTRLRWPKRGEFADMFFALLEPGSECPELTNNCWSRSGKRYKWPIFPWISFAQFAMRSLRKSAS